MERSIHVALLILLLCGTAGAQASSPATLYLHGTIGSQQTGSYVAVPFHVPPGTDRLTVSFTYTGKEEHATVDLGIEDPDRFRGWSGGNKSSFTIATSDATPSYLPGPLPTGEWKLILGIAFLRPGNSVTYDAKVLLTSRGSTSAESFTELPLSSGPRWYRGDLHLHTAHSDGSCASQSGRSVPCPIFVSVTEAARHGLDFLAITDHNTTSHYDGERELQPYFDQLLLIPGRELTTYSGHLNIWGTTRFLDFRAGGTNPVSRNDLLAKARALGALTSINHPIGPEAERCIGCAWNTSGPEPATDMRLVSAIEVLNGPPTGAGAFFHQPDIFFWEMQLRRGFHITAVGGSDTHRADLDSIGLPTTVVLATELSVAAILDGIRAGHVFIDLTGSRDLARDHPRFLELEAASGTNHARMGDTLLLTADEPVTLITHVGSSEGSELRLLVDGSPEPQLPTILLDRADQTATATWRPKLASGEPHWIRAEVHGRDGAIQLLSNPVYLSPASH